VEGGHRARFAPALLRHVVCLFPQGLQQAWSRVASRQARSELREGGGQIGVSRERRKPTHRVRPQTVPALGGVEQRLEDEHAKLSLQGGSLLVDEPQARQDLPLRFVVGRAQVGRDRLARLAATLMVVLRDEAATRIARTCVRRRYLVFELLE